MDLKEFLQDRIGQLKNRKMMIPRYVERPGGFLGKKDFSLDDIPKIDVQIAEAEAALRAVNEFRKTVKHG